MRFVQQILCGHVQCHSGEVLSERPSRINPAQSGICYAGYLATMVVPLPENIQLIANNLKDEGYQILIKIIGGCSADG